MFEVSEASNVNSFKRSLAVYCYN